MLTGIDHLVIIVTDLAQAVRQYTGVGFAVAPGGRHPGGSHNALIALADGAYIELLAFESANPSHRWWPLFERVRRHGPALADFAMASGDLAADLRALRHAGVAMGDPYPGSRVRPDGYTVQWRLSTPPAAQTGVAPFLIQDVTPRAERVPGERTHPNGITGIDTLSIVTDDLTWVRHWSNGMLPDVGRRTPAHPVAGAARMPVGIGPHVLQFVHPEGPSDSLSALLGARGPSPAGATLRTADGRTRHLSAAGSLET